MSSGLPDRIQLGQKENSDLREINKPEQPGLLHDLAVGPELSKLEERAECLRTQWSPSYTEAVQREVLALILNIVIRLNTSITPCRHLTSLNVFQHFK